MTINGVVSQSVWAAQRSSPLSDPSSVAYREDHALNVPIARRTFVVALAGFSLTSCASVTANLPKAPSLPMSSQQDYRVQPGDVLETVFPAAPDHDEQVVVAPDGLVTIAYAPNLLAAGKSLAQITQAAALAAGINETTFSIRLRSSAGTRAYVIGEVATPGEIVVDGTITALQAISRAGGPKVTTANLSQVVLLRRDQLDHPQVYGMDLAAALSGRDPSADVELKPFDIVYVPRDRIGNLSLVFERIRQAVPISSYVTFAGTGNKGIVF